MLSLMTWLESLGPMTSQSLTPPHGAYAQSAFFKSPPTPVNLWPYSQGCHLHSLEFHFGVPNLFIWLNQFYSSGKQKVLLNCLSEVLQSSSWGGGHCLYIHHLLAFPMYPTPWLAKGRELSCYAFFKYIFTLFETETRWGQLEYLMGSLDIWKRIC